MSISKNVIYQFSNSWHDEVERDLGVSTQYRELWVCLRSTFSHFKSGLSRAEDILIRFATSLKDMLVQDEQN